MGLLSQNILFKLNRKSRATHTTMRRDGTSGTPGGGGGGDRDTMEEKPLHPPQRKRGGSSGPSPDRSLLVFVSMALAASMFAHLNRWGDCSHIRATLGRVALTRGCQLGYTHHTGWLSSTGCALTTTPY